MLRAGSKGVWDEWMGIQLECQYEEDLTKQPEARVRWYEAAGTYGGVLASRPNSKKRPLVAVSRGNDHMETPRDP